MLCSNLFEGVRNHRSVLRPRCSVHQFRSSLYQLLFSRQMLRYVQQLVANFVPIPFGAEQARCSGFLELTATVKFRSGQLNHELKLFTGYVDDMIMYCCLQCGEGERKHNFLINDNLPCSCTVDRLNPV